MDNEILVYAKYDENNSIIAIRSSIFLNDNENWTQIDQWKHGQDRYVYAHADNGEYVQSKHGKSLFDDLGRPNYHDNFIEWNEEEKDKLYPVKQQEEKQKQEAQLEMMMAKSAIVTFLNDLPDEQAVEIPLCFDSWGSYPDGYHFAKDMRVEHNAGLWKCKQDHDKQESWYPGAEGTLWEQLDKEEHTGTLEDPIPVPDSVNVSGFTYVVGKYYLENEIKYLCKFGETEEGKEITLYYKPSELLNQYFVQV